jgi:hypothetical protein
MTTKVPRSLHLASKVTAFRLSGRYLDNHSKETPNTLLCHCTISPFQHRQDASSHVKRIFPSKTKKTKHNFNAIVFYHGSAFSTREVIVVGR